MLNEKEFIFDGKIYSSYRDMVSAKRQRNQDILESSGLLQASHDFHASVFLKKKKVNERGIISIKVSQKPNLPLRRSGRLKGEKSDGLYIEHESNHALKVGKNGSNLSSNMLSQQEAIYETESTTFKGRMVDDGEAFTLQESMKFCGRKWCNNTEEEQAAEMVSLLTSLPKSRKGRNTKNISCNIYSQIQNIEANDETCVAKVVPNRIYSVTFHPSYDKIICVAGDKEGYIGFWDVDSNSNSDKANVYLCKPHGRPVSNLYFTNNGTKLYSSSYDSSIRCLDIEKQLWTEPFATYDDTDLYSSKLGFGYDEGYRYWLQYMCVINDRTMLLSTSTGTIMGIDLRLKGSSSVWKSHVSEKKVNTVSLHPNGHTLATAGLDTTVNLWDIRKIQKEAINPTISTPLAIQFVGKSVNSAFFSPSGAYLLTTTQLNTIDIFSHAHLHNSTSPLKPDTRIRHDNKTGRWLSTFMAVWHPSSYAKELFVSGSMVHPRTMELFDGSSGKLVYNVQGDALRAVVSRCCFHERVDRILCCGGNSSGRLFVTKFKKCL